MLEKDFAMSTRVRRILGHLACEKELISQFTSNEGLPHFKNMELALDGRVALVTFTRERNLNALGPAFLKDLADVLAYLEDRGDIGCIVLTGNKEARKKKRILFFQFFLHQL